MIASMPSVSCAPRVRLSHGRALYAYSYLTSGRVEINSLNRCVTPTVQLSGVVAKPVRSPFLSTRM